MAADTPASSQVSSPPTPPAQIATLGLASLVLAAVGAVLAALALRSVHSLAEDPSVVLTGSLWALGLVACLPLVPAATALSAVRRRRRLTLNDQLPIARQVSSTGREHATTAMGYALATIIGAAIVSFATANDGAIATTFLRWEFIAESWQSVLSAFWVNVRVAVGAEVLVLVFGLILAIMRLLPGRSGRALRWIAISYVDVFRAIPSIIVLYLVGFGLSLANVPIVREFSPIWLAILALTLTYSGYVAEVYRAGLESLHPSQWAAARSLGLSYAKTLRTVIIPQAVRRIVPPLLNDFIGLQKDTALIGVMGVTDAFTQSRLVASDVFNLTPVIVVAVLFVAITIPQARFVDVLIARGQERREGGGL